MRQKELQFLWLWKQNHWNLLGGIKSQTALRNMTMNWHMGVVVPILINWGPEEGINYQSNKLLNFPAQAYHRMLERWLQMTVKCQNEEKQQRFHRGRERADQLCIHTRILRVHGSSTPKSKCAHFRCWSERVQVWVLFTSNYKMCCDINRQIDVASSGMQAF